MAQANVISSISRSTRFVNTTIFILMASTFIISYIQSNKINEREKVEHQLLLAKDIKYHSTQIQQFLTDASLTKEADSIKEASENFEHAKQKIEELKALNSEIKSDELLANLESLNAIGLKMTDAYVKEGFEAGNKIMKEKDTGFDAMSDKYSKTLDEVSDVLLKNAEAIKSELLFLSEIIPIVLLSLGLATIVISFISSKLLVKKNINKISEIIFGEINKSVDLSKQYTTLSADLAGQTSEVASTLEQMMHNVDSLSTSVKSNVQAARDALQLSNECKEFASQSSVQFSELSKTMEKIDMSSKNIKQFTNVIDDIAFQTNLLALNASVEAARAGEQGKGFAVVAEAVRSLSQRSSEAAKQISNLVNESNAQVSNGVGISKTSIEIIDKLTATIDKVTQFNQSITEKSTEQSTAVEGIVMALQQVDKSTQSNAASAEQISHSADELSRSTDYLYDTVQQSLGAA